MRIFFILILSLLLTASTLMSSAPNTTKELSIFMDKVALQNAQDMFGTALDLYYANKTDEMIREYKRLISEFGNSTNEEIKVMIAQSMFNLALGYKKKNDIKAEKKLYEQIILNFVDSSDKDIEFITANSLFNQGAIAYDMNDTKGEIEIYQKFLDEFKNTNNENIITLKASAMAILGHIYSATNDKDRAIDIYNDLIRKFENSQDEYVQNLVVGSFLNLGVNYIDLGNPKEGLSLYKEIIERFKNSTNPYVVETVGAAVTNKIEFEICNDIKPSFSDENEELADKSEYSIFMYEFLQILYAATKEQQAERLDLWRNKYSYFNLKDPNIDFDFSHLNRLVERLESPKKDWVKECLDALKKFAE
ncbi:MAG: tetratricopeptide repeat protein [Campylobacteraceae bacterium]|jgi:tetratricopeptide (TPR) repeat protein|nr:tetratricopeptide repeat protein [Campylobacteraceae bacterium]